MAQVTHKYGWGDRVTVNPDTYHGGKERAEQNAADFGKQGLIDEWHAFSGKSGTVVKQGVFLGVLPIYGVLLDEPQTVDGTEIGGFTSPLAISEEELIDGDQ